MTGPSLRFTRVSLFGDMPISRTEYICGLNTRSESCSCRGHSETTPPTNVRYESVRCVPTSIIATSTIASNWSLQRVSTRHIK